MGEIVEKGMRLQKYLSTAGVASRRKAEEIIAQGKVKVNGKVITEMGMKIDPYQDIVEIDGRQVKPAENKVYIMLNKPAGYVTTTSDQFGRPMVLDLLKGVETRVYPVGRLDYDTSGLLLLTNDGDFTYRITHPSHEITKTYIAKVKGNLGQNEIDKLKNGVKVEDYITAPAKVRVIESGEKISTVEISIHEGKNRQVRKMFSAVGHDVIQLQRVAIGTLKIGDLQEGKWRYLSSDEIDKLIKQL